MKFEKHFPTSQLKNHILYYVVAENDVENEYKVFPSTGLVIGFQYQGQLSAVKDNHLIKLDTAGITGITDSYKIFKNTSNTRTILVYFTETGFTHFSSRPTHELFNQSISLEYIFDRIKVAEVEEKLASANTDKQRVHIVERFLLSQLRDIQSDKLIAEAVKLIHQSSGSIRIKELNKQLLISQSPFEKRFRKVVGTTPKKFASIIRFNHLLGDLKNAKSLTDICYENNFFDQAHFIKDFKKFTGESPEHFKRSL
jgi:AraC-like DNA-binding protein